MKVRDEVVAACDLWCLIMSSIIVLYLIFTHTAPWPFILLYWTALVAKYGLSTTANVSHRNKNEDKR